MPLDLTNPSQQTTGFAQDSLGNNILFALTNISSQGSGNINAFLRLQGSSGSTVEQGYNTNGTIEFDTLKQPSNKAITRSQLPAITINGKVYREFRIDLNESSSNPQINLEKLQVFTSGSSTLTGYNQITGTLGGLSAVINLNDQVKLNAALNSGSGSGDVLVYLPDSVFGSGNPYIYIYSKFSSAESGFEEFSYSSSTTLGGFADLSLTKTFADTTPNTLLSVGDQVDFTLKITNTAITGLPNTTATGVQVKDLLPAGFSFVSATGGTYNASTGIWSVGSVAVGQTQTLTIRANVLGTGTIAAAYTNTAEIVASNQLDPDSNPNNGVATEDDRASVVAAPIKLSITNQFTSGNVAPSADVGRFVALPDGKVSFQIGVTNNGFASLSNVVVFDDLTKLLPVGLKVGTIAGDGQVYDSDANAQTVERLFSSIGVGETKTITVNAQVVAGADNNYITPIQLSGVFGSVNPANNSVDTQLNEYHGAPFDGTFWLSTNFTKAAGQTIADFGFLNILNTAQISSINGASLAPGTIQSNQARLDVATFKITGTLTETDGSTASFTVLSYDPLDGTQYSFAMDADLILSGAKGFASNQSLFLPPGDLGSAIFNLRWYKPTDDPNFSSNLAAWTGFSSSANTATQKSIVDFLTSRFINRGAGSNLLFESGTFQLTNLTQNKTATITVEAGQFTPQTTNATPTTIVVTATGVTIGTQSFSSLQAALNSLNFATPTNVTISFQGSGAIATSVQSISGNFNYTNNWQIQQINVASGVTAIFSSGNGAATYDFSLIDINLGTSSTVQLLGANAVDSITGSSGSQTLSGSNGTDVLDGFGGNDIYNGSLGPDTFVLRPNGVATVQDFSPSNDQFGLTDGLTFAQLRFATNSNGGTLIYYQNLDGTSLLLANVLGVNPSAFNSSVFVTV